MSTDEAEIRQMKRRRAAILKMVRQGHELQCERLDDFGVWATMQDIGMRMSRKGVITMLQDLAVLELLRFEQTWDDDNERMRLTKIELTATGLTITVRRKSTDEVLFD